MGNNLFISASLGCAPYSQISKDSACSALSPISFPYHFTNDALVSALMGLTVRRESHPIRSSLPWGTSTRYPPIHGSHSYICDSWASSPTIFIAYTEDISTDIS